MPSKAKHLERTVGASLKGRATRPRSGFTIIEVSLSTLIVGVTLVAALQTVGATRTGRTITADRALGGLLAQQLLSEVLHHPYEDPDGSPTFGIESGESGATRDGLDDVDDFDGWSASPPVRSDGAFLTLPPAWKREVHVDWVSSEDHSSLSVSETGVKRVQVYVYKYDVPVGFVAAIRTKGGDVMLELR